MQQAKLPLFAVFLWFFPLLLLVPADAEDVFLLDPGDGDDISPETLVYFQRTTRLYIPKDGILYTDYFYSPLT
jgi:hypothetical protein